MKTQISILKLTLLLVAFIPFQVHAQNTQKTTSKNTTTQTVQVIQFHSEHRCMTCNLIEKLTKETLNESFPNINFKLINVDESANEKIIEEFEATGTALFIYNPVTKKKKDLTDFAFMNVKSKPDTFKKGLKKAIQQF